MKQGLSVLPVLLVPSALLALPALLVLLAQQVLSEQQEQPVLLVLREQPA